ncbi:MAG: ribonuclease H-like domain-containing protein [Candidatus Eisenbacteria bacterium]
MSGRGEALSRALSRLAERRTQAALEPGPSVPRGTPTLAPGELAREEVGVESFLPGRVIENSYGKVYLHERLRSEIEKPLKKWGRYPAKLSQRLRLHDELDAFAERGAANTAFFDLETCGLSNAPVFLAGTMHWNGTDYVVRQYFARDYAEEAALVDELARHLAGFETIVTYNGKSYDVPFLADRAALHKVPFTRPGCHVDLVHHARRRWAGVLPNCRLVTIEQHVCRRRRVGDVPGSEIPDLYHDFVKYGAAHRMIPVFHHNLLDVITMDEILRALVSDPPDLVGEEEGAWDRAGR